jgi:hypothetical protein
MEFFIALVVLAGAAIIGYKILNKEKSDGSHPLDSITPAPVKEIVTEDGAVQVAVKEEPKPVEKAEVKAKPKAPKTAKAPAKTAEKATRKPGSKKPKMTVAK